MLVCAFYKLEYLSYLAVMLPKFLILRYCRSRFFTFVFFMQKLTKTSSGNNYKSCGIFHHKSNKIDFTFF
jgi:hypothetical protein